VSCIVKVWLRAIGAVGILVSGSSGAQANETPPLEGTAWVLAALPGQKWVGAPATLRFEGARAVGSDGCNRFNASFTATGSALEVGPRAASTLKACPPALMAQAEAFSAALTGAKAYRIEAGQLKLLTASGTVLATLAAQSRAIAGTNWKITGINNGRNALVSILAGSTVTMAFGTDGRASGSAGCNQYTARFSAGDTKLRFEAPAATRKMCADAKLMEQESQFLKALTAVTAMEIEGDRLVARDGGGAMQLTATRE
jgi:heat shock protein HslJ